MIFAKRTARCAGRLKPMPKLFSEEERSKQPSVFSVLRALTREFRNENDDKLAFAGAFGYDLLFQFEPIPLRLSARCAKDLQLFLCDDMIYMDRKRETIERFTYEFETTGRLHAGLERTGERVPAAAKARRPRPSHRTTRRKNTWRTWRSVREGMRQGDYYEVVLRQTFRTPYAGKASELFVKMQKANPSPYEFLIQFGDEQLVGASPEMFVRVEGEARRNLPLSGTARRTGDPLRMRKISSELLGSTQRGVGTDHVYGRGPERQEPGLRTGHASRS